MKKISILFLMVFLIVGTLGFVVADDDSEEIDIPEVKRIGFFENAFDHIKFVFIFNRERKIQRALELAEKRLAEAIILAEEDPDKIEEAQERYGAFVAKAEEILEKIANTKTENEDVSMDNMKKITWIRNRFEIHEEQIGRIYVRAFERFDKNNASDEKIERFQNFKERALNRSNKMEERILQKREMIIKRHKVLAEKSDEELEDILEDIEKKEGLTIAREQRIERAGERIQKIVAIRQKNLNKIIVRLDEVNLTDEQKEQIASKIEIANQSIQKFETKAWGKIDLRRKELNLPLSSLNRERLVEESGNSENAVN